MGSEGNQATVIRAMHELSNPVHWRILAEVTRRERCVSAIAEETGLLLPAVSKSLKRLKQYGLLEERRERTEHRFAANPTRVQLDHDNGVLVARLTAADGGSLTVVQPVVGLEPARNGRAALPG